MESARNFNHGSFTARSLNSNAHQASDLYALRQILKCRAPFLGKGPVVLVTLLGILLLSFFFLKCFFFDRVLNKDLMWQGPDILIVPAGFFTLFVLMSIWSLLKVFFTNPGYVDDYFTFKRSPIDIEAEKDADAKIQRLDHPLDQINVEIFLKNPTQRDK